MATKADIRAKNIRKIIHHAESLFAENGFNGTSTRKIAERAGLPKGNIHYYFKTKRDLYEAVLADILSSWIHDADIFEVSDDPQVVLRAYIRKKMEHSFSRPNGSKTWAMEVILGGPVFGQEIERTFLQWDEKIIAYLNRWIAEKKMRKVDPQTLLNMIWATTQHYADFEYQISTLNGGKSLNNKQRETAIENVCSIVLGGVLLQ